MKIHALMFLAFAALASVGCSGGGNGGTPDVDVAVDKAGGDRPVTLAVRQ